MADAPLYLFDGYNLLHATPFEAPTELVDALASFVAERGARGIVVFDGVGADVSHGPLAVRFARDADALLERLAAEHRRQGEVLLVTSDATVGHAAGIDVRRISSQRFVRELEPRPARPERPRGLAGKLDDETRAALERLRRGE